MSTTHGNMEPDKNGYSFIFSTNVLASIDKNSRSFWDCEREFLFHYDSTVTNDEFDLDKALEATEKWWNIKYGSDNIKVKDYFVLNESDHLKGRTFFMVVTVPIYQQYGRYWTLTQLKQEERRRALAEQKPVSHKEAMDQIIAYSPEPRKNPFYKG